MAQEIERKFLVDAAAWQKLEKSEGKHYIQGYLANNKDRVIRIRIAGDDAYLTIKGGSAGISRAEYEYAIPKIDAEEMFALFKPEGTEKIRYRIPAGGGLTWEVDEFLGVNGGLLIAEIELEHEDQLFEIPDWLGPEVSDDGRYSNASLALHPFKSW